VLLFEAVEAGQLPSLPGLPSASFSIRINKGENVEGVQKVFCLSSREEMGRAMIESMRILGQLRGGLPHGGSRSPSHLVMTTTSTGDYHKSPFMG
jgi:hypothetical protein